jgi:hypothetical protein
MINVYPINDLEEHTLDSTCKCTPTIKEEYGQNHISNYQVMRK